MKRWEGEHVVPSPLPLFSHLAATFVGNTEKRGDTSISKEKEARACSPPAAFHDHVPIRPSLPSSQSHNTCHCVSGVGGLVYLFRPRLYPPPTPCFITPWVSVKRMR
eukprot:Hpha_TRINITY_DN15121_c0_g2::TRINITY_DN15121_c0_g2_i1::g.126527::m.126527